MRSILMEIEFTSGVVLTDTITTNNPAVKAFGSFPKGNKNDCFYLRQNQLKDLTSRINKERPLVLTLKGNYANFKAADPHNEIVYKAPDTFVVTCDTQNPYGAYILPSIVSDILDCTSEVTTDTPLLDNERLIFDSVLAIHEFDKGGQATVEAYTQARNWRKEWLNAYFNDDLFFGRRIETIKNVTIRLI